MAVDITLVLRSEHRRLQKLADRCGRNSRGFHDPVCDLRRALRAHTRAASELYSSAGPGIQDGAAAATLADVRQSAENDAGSRTSRRCPGPPDPPGHRLADLTGRSSPFARFAGRQWRLPPSSMSGDWSLLALQVPATTRPGRAELELQIPYKRVERSCRTSNLERKAAVNFRSVREVGGLSPDTSRAPGPRPAPPHR